LTMIGMVGSAAKLDAGALNAANDTRAVAMRSFFMIPPEIERACSGL
jgi:hypothetical protein